MFLVPNIHTPIQRSKATTSAAQHLNGNKEAKRNGKTAAPWEGVNPSERGSVFPDSASCFLPPPSRGTSIVGGHNASRIG